MYCFILVLSGLSSVYFFVMILCVLCLAAGHGEINLSKCTVCGLHCQPTHNVWLEEDANQKRQFRKEIILQQCFPSRDRCNNAVCVVGWCVAMYRRMISDRKYGLTYSLMASKVLPVLIPHSVNPALNTHQVVLNRLCIYQLTVVQHWTVERRWHWDTPSEYVDCKLLWHTVQT